MLLNLTDLSGEPLQGQISRQIRAKILNGELNAGASIPSIRELARECKVSVITVQRAYETLEREGLIHSRRAKGFFVSEIHTVAKKEMSEDRLIQAIEPLVKTALAEGLTGDDIIGSVRAILIKVLGPS